MKKASLTAFPIRFTPSVLMCFLALLSILGFVCLGVWQLHRASEKKEMLTKEQRYANHEPIAWRPGDALPMQYQRIHVTGHFLREVILLDNQYASHQWGYHVLSALLLKDGQVLMVDRGFLPGDITRRQMPQVDIPKGVIEISGSAYYPSKKLWLLGAPFEKKERGITIIELASPKILNQILHKSVYPFIIRLGKQEMNGYMREWTIVAMPPERHYAYAVQWFAIALVIFILFVALNIQKREENGSS